MTLSRAKRINGLEYTVRTFEGKGKSLFEVSTTDGRLNYKTSDHDLKKAIEKCVDEVYREWKAQVFMAQGWRCAQCAERKPLECDHRIPRSKGRDDRKSNLVGLCADCHRKKHGGR